MREHPKELRIPPQAFDDPQAFEMLRVWAADKKQHVSLMSVPNKDPAVWGVFLADLVRHCARAYHLNYGNDLTETTRTIRKAFEAEMDHMTDWGEGSLM